MKLQTIYDNVNSLAPFALSAEFCEQCNGYDNSGILIDCGEEIAGVLFSLDLSLQAVARAKACGANCIVTHHPAIYAPLRSLKTGGEGEAVLACARAGISVISAHLNLDCATGGIDDSLMLGLGGERAEEVMCKLSDGGYGKAFCIKPQPITAFVEGIRNRFSTERVVAYGDKEVHKIACFCGAGMDGDSVAFALRTGADTFVSSDGKHHFITELAERGVNVVLLTHYAAEQYGFQKFYQSMKKILSESGVRAELYTDERFL